VLDIIGFYPCAESVLQTNGSSPSFDGDEDPDAYQAKRSKLESTTVIGSCLENPLLLSDSENDADNEPLSPGQNTKVRLRSNVVR